MQHECKITVLETKVFAALRIGLFTLYCRKLRG